MIIADLAIRLLRSEIVTQTNTHRVCIFTNGISRSESRDNAETIKTKWILSMSLYSHWKHILKKAWSIRFMALAGLLTGCQTVFEYTGYDWLPFHKSVTSLIILILTMAAFISRLVAQKDV